MLYPYNYEVIFSAKFYEFTKQKLQCICDHDDAKHREKKTVIEKWTQLKVEHLNMNHEKNKEKKPAPNKITDINALTIK